MRRYMIALVATGLAAAGVSGCGNVISTDIIGAMGVTVNQAGAPVLVVAVCPDADHAVDTVHIYRHQTGSRTAEEDVPLGTWHAVDPVTRLATLTLAAPSSRWTTQREPPSLQSGPGYSALGFSTSADAEATQLDFSLADLNHLRAGMVSYRAGTVEIHDFRTTACDHHPTSPHPDSSGSR